MWFWRTATEPQSFCGLPAGPREGVFAFGSGLQSGVDDAWLSCLLKQRRGPTQRVLLCLDQFRLERAWVRSRQFVVGLPPRRRLGWMRDGLGHPWKASGDDGGAKRNAGHGGIRALNLPLALAQRVIDAGCLHAIAVTRYSVTILRCAVDALHAREVVAWKENVGVSAIAEHCVVERPSGAGCRMRE